MSNATDDDGSGDGPPTSTSQSLQPSLDVVHPLPPWTGSLVFDVPRRLGRQSLSDGSDAVQPPSPPIVGSDPIDVVQPPPPPPPTVCSDLIDVVQPPPPPIVGSDPIDVVKLPPPPIVGSDPIDVVQAPPPPIVRSVPDTSAGSLPVLPPWTGTLVFSSHHRRRIRRRSGDVPRRNGDVRHHVAGDGSPQITVAISPTLDDHVLDSTSPVIGDPAPGVITVSVDGDSFPAQRDRFIPPQVPIPDGISSLSPSPASTSRQPSPPPITSPMLSSARDDLPHSSPVSRESILDDTSLLPPGPPLTHPSDDGPPPNDPDLEDLKALVQKERPRKWIAPGPRSQLRKIFIERGYQEIPPELASELSVQFHGDPNASQIIQYFRNQAQLVRRRVLANLPPMPQRTPTSHVLQRSRDITPLALEVEADRHSFLAKKMHSTIAETRAQNPTLDASTSIARELPDTGGRIASQERGRGRRSRGRGRRGSTGFAVPITD